MTILTQTQPSVKTEEINPRLHLSAVYQDSIGFQIIAHWCGQGTAIDISNESGKTIMATVMLVNAIDESDGYDNNPSAAIHHLRPNEFAQLLNDEEKQTVAQFQWDATPRATERSRHIISGRFR